MYSNSVLRYMYVHHNIKYTAGLVQVGEEREHSAPATLGPTLSDQSSSAPGIDIIAVNGHDRAAWPVMADEAVNLIRRKRFGPVLQCLLECPHDTLDFACVQRPVFSSGKDHPDDGIDRAGVDSGNTVDGDGPLQMLSSLSVDHHSTNMQLEETVVPTVSSHDGAEIDDAKERARIAV